MLATVYWATSTQAPPFSLSLSLSLSLYFLWFVVVEKNKNNISPLQTEHIPHTPSANPQRVYRLPTFRARPSALHRQIASV